MDCVYLLPCLASVPIGGTGAAEACRCGGRGRRCLGGGHSDTVSGLRHLLPPGAACLEDHRRPFSQGLEVMLACPSEGGWGPHLGAGLTSG